jgi:hypothetical protein
MHLVPDTCDVDVLVGVVCIARDLAFLFVGELLFVFVFFAVCR